MSTLEHLKKTEQRLARLERNHAMQKIKARKRDARRKIELGGLVIKAKMQGFTKDIILGALLDAKHQLESDPNTKRLFEIKGQQAFLEQDE